MLAGGQGGVQVIIQQPVRRGDTIPGIIVGGQGAGVLAEQVVQQVAAGCGLGEQVLVIQLIEAAAGLVQADVIERGGGVGVDTGARDQAEAAEQPLLGRGEVGVGQAERCGDRQVLRPHEGQPVAAAASSAASWAAVQAGWCRSWLASIPIASGRYPHSWVSSPTAAIPGVDLRAGLPAAQSESPPRRGTRCRG